MQDASIPACHALPAPAAPAPARRTAGARRMVLIVAQPGPVRAELSRAVLGARHIPRFAESAQQALQEALAWDPAAVLLDLGMADLEGVAAARLLGGDPRTAQLRCLVFCGAGQRQRTGWSQRLGISECVSAPFTVNKLRTCLAGRAQGGGT